MAAKRAALASLLSGPSSARKMAAMMPTGTAMAAAIPTITKVPAIALPKPPPVSKPVGGSSVNTSTLRRAPPRVISM
ncbi:hypothetical protein D3C81_2030970 [compost metagenome]